MITDKTIFVTASEFRQHFPELSGASDLQIKNAYISIGAYISPVVGTIALSPDIQELGVFLACAHLVYLSLHSDEFRPVASASQGSVTAAFVAAPTNGTWEYFLSTTKYGLQLLSILKQIQPLIPDKANLSGYYSN